MPTESEIFNFALRHYNNPSCVTAVQFTNDYNIIRCVNRLFVKRSLGKEVNPRVILNHVLTAFNVFDPKACVELFFLKIDPRFHSEIKTFISFLNYLPDSLDHINIQLEDIEFDQEYVEFLRGI